MATKWRYAELEVRYGGGHERPTAVRWSPPEPTETIEFAAPGQPDPLTSMIVKLGGIAERASFEPPVLLHEVHLLNAIGAMGWRLLAAPSPAPRDPGRVRYLFVCAEEATDVRLTLRHASET